MTVISNRNVQRTLVKPLFTSADKADASALENEHDTWDLENDASHQGTINEHNHDRSPHQMIADLSARVDRAGEAFARELTSLAEDVVRRVLGRLDPKKTLMAAIEATIREHGLLQPTVLELGPADAALLGDEDAPDREDQHPPRYVVEINPQLQPGEAVLRCFLGRIQAGPINRSADLFEQLRELP